MTDIPTSALVATSIQFGVDRISYSVSKQAVKLQDTLLNHPPSKKELSAMLFCEEFESYSAHRGACDRGHAPSLLTEEAGAAALAATTFIYSFIQV